MSNTQRPNPKKTRHAIEGNEYSRVKNGCDEPDPDLFSPADRSAEIQTKAQKPVDMTPKGPVAIDAVDLYLTDRDVAKRYKVTKQTVWRWAKENLGFPKPYKFMGVTRWVGKELDDFDRTVMGTRP